MTERANDTVAAEPAEIVREYGPYTDHVRGVTHDGERVWFASGARIQAIDPDSGAVVRAIEVAADAGTAYDGEYLFQIAGARIHRIDPMTGHVVSSIPAPGAGDDAGLAWADGVLWVGQYRGQRIYQIDPDTGAILRTIESNRFVTGVTWVDGELWHGTRDDAGGAIASELRQVDPVSGEVLERLAMPSGAEVSGIEADRGDLLYCGGGRSGTIRAVRRPKPTRARKSR